MVESAPYKSLYSLGSGRDDVKPMPIGIKVVIPDPDPDCPLCGVRVGKVGYTGR